MNPEKWRKIRGFEHYSVSTHGRVKRTVKSPIANNGFKPPQFLKPIPIGIPGKQYLLVRLYKNGKWKWKRIYHLVLETFVRQKRLKEQTNHKDGNKFNNKLENLEWISASENMKHAFKNGLEKPKYGSENGNSKLKEEQVIKIRSEYASGKKSKLELSKIYGVSDVQIGNIVECLQWKHI